MRVWFVAALLTVIVAPGITAPLSSVTTPVIVPVACAGAFAGTASANAARNEARSSNLRMPSLLS